MKMFDRVRLQAAIIFDSICIFHASIHPPRFTSPIHCTLKEDNYKLSSIIFFLQILCYFPRVVFEVVFRIIKYTKWKKKKENIVKVNFSQYINLVFEQKIPLSVM